MIKEGIEVKISSNGKEVEIFEIRKDSTKVKLHNFKTNLLLKSKNKSFYIVFYTFSTHFYRKFNV